MTHKRSTESKRTKTCTGAGNEAFVMVYITVLHKLISMYIKTVSQWLTLIASSVTYIFNFLLFKKITSNVIIFVICDDVTSNDGVDYKLQKKRGHTHKL